MDSQLSAAPPHSPSEEQPRCACPDAMLHVPSFGPSSHRPTPSASGSEQSKWLFGNPKIVVLSVQPLGTVACPTLPQDEPGHSLATAHAAPTFVPLRQRRPPQIGP